MPFESESTRCRAAQNAWAKLPVHTRLKPLKPLRHLIAENAQRLALTATQDVGRDANEVVATDILPTADGLRFLERHAKRILQANQLSGWQRPVWLIGERETIHRRPHGIVGVIGTWNYPILLNAVPIAQALVAGNGVLWKPSELASTGSEYLHELFITAGFPKDLFIRLPASREAGPQLAEADIDHLLFTGSADVGRKLAARLGERLVSSTMELSGCDAQLVLHDADVAMAAKAAWYGATLNAGQTCLAVRRSFVHRTIYPQFCELLKPFLESKHEEILALPGQVAQAERLVQEAIEQGGRSLLPHTPANEANDPPRFETTIVIDAHPQMRICQEASFAPILAVIPFDDETTLLSEIEKCDFGLAASIFTRDVRRAEELGAQLRVGSVSINDVVVATAHPAVPFGGLRASGWGVTRGREGLLEMTVPQAISHRKGTFRPHFDGASLPANTALVRGLLAFNHAPTLRARWAGLWRVIKGLVKK